MARKTFQITAIALLCPILALAQQQRGVSLQHQETTATAGKTYAIVIGISNYKEVNPLRFADKDAETFAEFLLRKTGMGLDSNNVFLFVNEQATKNNIGNALSDVLVRKKVGRGDRVIFFFAGHGDYDANVMKDQALLLLWGAPKESYFQNIFGGDYISTLELNNNFIDQVAARGGEVMLIVDACHASGTNQKLSGGAEGGRITAMALQSMTSPIKIYSCKENEYSLEGEQWGGGHGLFSYVMMQGLYGLADANKDGTVSFRELQRYLEDNVADMAAPNKQDPVVKIDDTNKPIAKVDNTFLTAYQNNKSRTLPFLGRAGTKGSLAGLELGMDSAQRRLFRECDSFINKNDLASLLVAYGKFKEYVKKDSTSDASLLLRRNLSAALQADAVKELTPTLTDGSDKYWDKDHLAVERYKLMLSDSLLGNTHFLHNQLADLIRCLGAMSDNTKVVLEVTYSNIDGHISGIMSNDFQNNTPSKTKASIEILQKIIKKNPSLTIAQFALGRSYFNVGKYDSAIAAYKSYIGFVPKSVEAYFNIAKCEEAKKDYGNAKTYYTKALDLCEPTKQFRLLAKLYELLNTPQYHKEAIFYLDRAKSLLYKEDYRSEYEAFSKSLWERGDFENSLCLIKKMNIDSTFLSDFVYNVIKKYTEIKKYDSAFLYMDKMLGKNINFTNLSYGRGNDQIFINHYSSLKYTRDYSKNKWKRLLGKGHDLELLFFIDPAFDSLRKQPAFIGLMEKYFPKQEVEQIQTFLSTGFGQLESLEMDGDSLYTNGKYQEANDRYKKAMGIEPDIEYFPFKASCAYTQLQTYDTAILYLEKVLQKEKVDSQLIDFWKDHDFYYQCGVRKPNTFLNIIESNNDLKDLRTQPSFKALLGKYFSKEELASSPNLFKEAEKNDAYYRKIGDRYYESRQYDKAIESYNKAIQSDPKGVGLSNDLYNISCCYSLLNNKDSALSYFERYLKIGDIDLAHLTADTDMDNIRTLPTFRKLLEKYVGKEVLSAYPNIFMVRKKN